LVELRRTAVNIIEEPGAGSTISAGRGRHQWTHPMVKLSSAVAALAATALSASVFASPALAQNPHPAGVKVGVLTCNESSGWGFVFGSSRKMRCTFSPNGDHVQRYTGDISKFGVDVGYQQAGVLLWAVIAPTKHVAPNALAGHYGGLTAGASVGVGVGANALIGGSGRTIALQPLSIEGTTGLNLAAGIGELTLHYVPYQS
jgi:hypothetical protein